MLPLIFPAAIQAPAHLQAPTLDAQWDSTFLPNLAHPIWGSAESAYDWAHYLLVPVNAAFALDKEKWIHDLQDMYARSLKGTPPLPAAFLDRNQWLFVESEFLALAAEHHKQDAIPNGMPEMLFGEVRSQWLDQPAWEWDRAPFHGFKERLTWKLASPPTHPSYYRIVLDEEMHLLGVAANLVRYKRAMHDQVPKEWGPLLGEMMHYSAEVVKKQGTFTEKGRWVPQLGLMDDHPDFKYSAETMVKPNLKPNPAKNTGIDTSHGTRWPAWLDALERAAAPGSEEQHVFHAAFMGFENQFFDLVVVPPSKDFPTYRTTNYTDGRNTVYRYGYESLGKNQGYGPYQTSGILFLGWYGLFRSPRSRELYAQLSTGYPFDVATRRVFLGPSPEGKEPDPSRLAPNNLLWFITELAAKL